MYDSVFQGSIKSTIPIFDAIQQSYLNEELIS